MEKIKQGTPLWDEPLNEQLGGLHTGKSDKTDVIPEVQTVTLTNSDVAPFNNSDKTIQLKTVRDNLDYTVQAEVVGGREYLGTAEVYDKALNGFKVRYSGLGTAEIKLYITGGFSA